LCSSFKQRVHLSSLVSHDVTSIRDVTLRIATKNPRPEAAYIHPIHPTTYIHTYQLTQSTQGGSKA